MAGSRISRIAMALAAMLAMVVAPPARAGVLPRRAADARRRRRALRKPEWHALDAAIFGVSLAIVWAGVAVAF